MILIAPYLWREYGNLSTRSIALPCAAEGYCDAGVDKCPYSRKENKRVTNLPLAPTMYISCSNVSTAIKAPLSLEYSLYHRINTPMRPRIAASQEVADGWLRHCDIINCVPFSVHITHISRYLTCIEFIHSVIYGQVCM